MPDQSSVMTTPFIVTADRLIGWELNDAEVVDFHEFFRITCGGSRHTGKLLVKAEVILDRSAGKRAVFSLYGDTFLGFNRLVQPLRKPAPRHHAAS